MLCTCYVDTVLRKRGHPLSRRDDSVLTLSLPGVFTL